MRKRMRTGGDVLRRRQVAGWIASAHFSKGGVEGEPGTGLTVHAINPEIGTDASIEGRFRLIREATKVVPPTGPATIYLTSAGFFGYDPAEPYPWIGVDDPGRLHKRLQVFADHLGSTAALLVGVDLDRSGSDQRLWWVREGHAVLESKRENEPSDLHLLGFVARGYICGAVLGQDGVRLHPGSDLGGVDVVLDAAHSRLNRVWDRVPNVAAKRFGFHQMIRRIGKRAGAVFAHAHGPNFTSSVRDCDNWIVFRGGEPFPGEREGRRISVNDG